MAKINLITAINQAFHQEMEKDKTVLVMGEDVGKGGGVFRATEGLQEKFGADRSIDTPLAESAIIGTAVGLAMNGMKPVAEIQFDGFSYYAFHQIKSAAAKIRTRYKGTRHCPMVIRLPYGGGIKALEEHSEPLETFYSHTPGLKVVIPSNPYDAKGLLISAIRDPDPVVFLEPKRIYRAFKTEVPEEEYTIPIGEAKVIQEGTDLTLISYGAMLHYTQKALEEMKDKPSIEIIDLRTLSPLDFDTILKSVQKTGRVVIVHEAPKNLGIGAEISARINEKALLDLKAPVKRVTGFDVPVPLAKLEDYYLPSAYRIKKGIREVMSF